MKLTLFSLHVTISLLAAYSVSTFYTAIVIGLSGTLRKVFITESYKAKFKETTHAMPLLRLCEACYMHRHEEDLAKEEETYRLLQEIIRSDALFKAMTGSSLKGELDPALDNLDYEQKKKLQHLMILEEKGFEVSNLKKKILENKR